MPQPPFMKKLFILLCLCSLNVSSFAATSYIVKKGDSLSKIAHKFGISVQELTSTNNISVKKVIYVGQKLSIPSKDISYTVKKGDTLSHIATRHKTSISAIKTLNPGLNPNILRVGETLKIPKIGSQRSYTAPSKQKNVSASLKTSLDKTPVRNKRWKYIVLHHSAVDRGSMKGLDRYHREERRMENGLAYHFVIGNGIGGMGDGEIGIGNRWKRQIQGGHVASAKLNQVAIGICLIGNFEKTRPTTKQMNSLEGLLRYLKKRTGLATSQIRSHQSINTKPTACPGKYLNMETIYNRVKY